MLVMAGFVLTSKISFAQTSPCQVTGAACHATGPYSIIIDSWSWSGNQPGEFLAIHRLKPSFPFNPAMPYVGSYIDSFEDLGLEPATTYRYDVMCAQCTDVTQKDCAYLGWNGYITCTTDALPPTTTPDQATPTVPPEITPTTPPTQNPAPVGSLDTADCTSFTGWACDASSYQTAIDVHFYDGDFYQGNAKVLGKATANSVSTDPAVSQNCGGATAHGYTFTVPESLKDNQPHNIYAYAIDTPDRNNNPTLPGSPKSITCAPTNTNTPTPTTPPISAQACTQNTSITLPAAATPTPTTGAENQAGTIKLAIRFQGIEYDNIAKEEYKTQNVKVGIIKQTADPLQNVTLETIMSKSFENVEVTAEKDPSSQIAIWRGEFDPAEVPAGDGYTILVKGPKHLQKKFCQNNPTEQIEQGFPYRCLGAGAISLTTTDNELNFTDVLLQGGDLPNQDGIINAYDVSRVLDILATGESTKDEDLQVADIDLNGIVNAKDRSYLIETLEEKYGDEE